MEVTMTDILIRDVPDEVLAAIDSKAKRSASHEPNTSAERWNVNGWPTPARSA